MWLLKRHHSDLQCCFHEDPWHRRLLEATCGFCLLWFWSYHHLCCPFSPWNLWEMGQSQPKQLHLVLNSAGWVPRMNWYKQRTMMENSRTLCPSIIFKCHLTGASQMTWFTGRKAVIMTIIIPTYCLLEWESLGGQTVLKTQCSWALKVKFKGQQSGIGTMAKAQSFEMNRRVNSQEVTVEWALLSSTYHMAWGKNQSDSVNMTPGPVLGSFTLPCGQRLFVRHHVPRPIPAEHHADIQGLLA